MRFWLIIIGLGLAGWWGYGQVRDALAFKPAEKVLEDVQRQTNPAASGSGPAPGGAENAIASSIRRSMGGGGGEDEPPHYSKVVRFANRPLPSPEILAQATASGVVVLADADSSSLYLAGPADKVESLAIAFERFDQVAGSAVAQAFVVFVSRRAVKGFDLVAALRTVGGFVDGVDLVAGGGAVNLDLRAGDLSAALDVMADGETIDVLQRPHVRLLQGVTSTVEAIDEIPVPSTTVSQGISQTSIEYRKVGLVLEVVPQFVGADRVRLAVSQSNGLIGPATEIDGNEIPTIQTQAVKSSVELTIGQSVVLGGVRTYRRTLKRGILRNVSEVEEGALYVILATASDAPRAMPVELSPPGNAFGLGGSAEDPGAWIDGELLPPRPDWINQDERDVIEGGLRRLGRPGR